MLNTGEGGGGFCLICSLLGPHWGGFEVNLGLFVCVRMVSRIVLAKPGSRISWRGLCGLAALLLVALLGGIGSAARSCKEHSHGSLTEENENHDSSRRATAAKEPRESLSDVVALAPRSGAQMTQEQRRLHLFGDEATVRQPIVGWVLLEQAQPVTMTSICGSLISLNKELAVRHNKQTAFRVFFCLHSVAVAVFDDDRQQKRQSMPLASRLAGMHWHSPVCCDYID